MPNILSKQAVVFFTTSQPSCKCGAALRVYDPHRSLSLANLEAVLSSAWKLKIKAKQRLKFQGGVCISSWWGYSYWYTQLVRVSILVYPDESCLQVDTCILRVVCLPWWLFIVGSMTLKGGVSISKDCSCKDYVKTMCTQTWLGLDQESRSIASFRC